MHTGLFRNRPSELTGHWPMCSTDRLVQPCSGARSATAQLEMSRRLSCAQPTSGRRSDTPVQHSVSDASAAAAPSCSGDRSHTPVHCSRLRRCRPVQPRSGSRLVRLAHWRAYRRCSRGHVRAKPRSVTPVHQLMSRLARPVHADSGSSSETDVCRRSRSCRAVQPARGVMSVTAEELRSSVWRRLQFASGDRSVVRLPCRVRLLRLRARQGLASGDSWATACSCAQDRRGGRGEGQGVSGEGLAARRLCRMRLG